MKPIIELSHRYKFSRWLVMIVSIINVTAAAVTLVLIWNSGAKLGTPMPARIGDTMLVSGSLLLAGVVFLIALRGGDQPANVILALAFAFAGANSICGILPYSSS